MTKLEKADAIAKAFEHVPIPIVAEGATVADVVLGLIEQFHGLDLTEEKTLIDDFAAARAPWQQIHDAATQAPATGATDVAGFVGGSPQD